MGIEKSATRPKREWGSDVHQQIALAAILSPWAHGGPVSSGHGVPTPNSSPHCLPNMPWHPSTGQGDPHSRGLSLALVAKHRHNARSCKSAASSHTWNNEAPFGQIRPNSRASGTTKTQPESVSTRLSVLKTLSSTKALKPLRFIWQRAGLRSQLRVSEENLACREGASP